MRNDKGKDVYFMTFLMNGLYLFSLFVCKNADFLKGGFVLKLFLYKLLKICLQISRQFIYLDNFQLFGTWCCSN